jgi:hypothetical protein
MKPAHQKPKNGRNFRKRIQSAWDASRWPIIGLAWLMTLILGTLGFQQYYSNDITKPQRPEDIPAITTLVYLSLQLFTLESGPKTGPLPLSLEIARWLAPLLAAYTAIAAITVIFAEQFQMLWLRMTRNHVVICGLGRRGYLLAMSFREKDFRVVVIEKDKENDLLDACREEGIPVLIGDASHPEMLERAGVSRARFLVAVNGEDAANAEIALRGMETRQNKMNHKRTGDLASAPLTCLVHITEPRLCDLLHEHEVSGENAKAVRLEFFSVYDMGARAILEQYPPFPSRIEGSLISPHILLIGLGSMGRSLLVRAARQWRERLQQARAEGVMSRDTDLPLIISVIDRHAPEKVNLLELRFPRLSKVCQVRALQMDIESPDFQKGDFLADKAGKCNLSVVYVCVDNVALSLTAGLTLYQHLRGRGVPIVMRTAHEASIASLLKGAEPIVSSSQAGIRELNAFGLLERTCRPELVLGGTHEILARSLHADYLRSQANQGVSVETNPFLVPWEHLSESRKEKNRRQADRLLQNLKENGYLIQMLTDWDAEVNPFTPDEIERMAQREHQLWLSEMKSFKWKLGPRDEIRRTNPHLVPWQDLPREIQDRNRFYYQNIQAMLAEAGLQVSRVMINSQP